MTMISQNGINIGLYTPDLKLYELDANTLSLENLAGGTQKDLKMGHLGLGATAPQSANYIIIDQTVTDPAAAMQSILTKTRIAVTAAPSALAHEWATSEMIVPATNTQNWTHATSGIIGFNAWVDIRAGATGTITAVHSFQSSASVAAMTITNLVHYYVVDASGAGTVTNQYGLYISNMTKGATLNYAIWNGGALIYTMGGIQNVVTPSVSANSQTLNAAPSATTLTAVNAKSFTATGTQMVIPAITPAANGSGITMTALNISQGAIANIADSEAITITQLAITGAAGQVLETGIYTWAGISVTMPAQAANGAANDARGVSITGGAGAGTGFHVYGARISMAAYTDNAIYVLQGLSRLNNGTQLRVIGNATTSAGQNINPDSASSALTAANGQSFYAQGLTIALPPITPVANGSGITLAGISLTQGAISSVADTENITVKQILITGGAGGALETGIYAFTGIDITTPAQAANNRSNAGCGIKITGGATAGAAGAYQRGIDITMAAVTDAALYIGMGVIINAGGDQNLLTLSVTANSQTLNAAPTATTVTAANTKSFTGSASRYMIPAIVPAANGTGIAMYGIVSGQGAISNVADSEFITITQYLITGAAGVALETGVYTWTGIDVTTPAQAANAASNMGYGIKITGGATAGEAGARQYGAYISMNATTDSAIFINQGKLTFAAANSIVMIANTALALSVTDGTTSLMVFDTRNTVTGVNAITTVPSTPTISSAAGDAYTAFTQSAYTINFTGNTGVTAMNGLQHYFGVVTVSGNTATCTIVTASSLYITPIVVGANMAITNNYMINTSVGGCFLTAAGVWTSTSGRKYKTDIQPIQLDEVSRFLDSLEVKSYRYIDTSDGGYKRFGLIAEEAPDYLATPTHDGIADHHMAGFSLAIAKLHQKRIAEMEEEIASLRAELAGRKN